MTEAEFLKRYEALCREAGMFVNACGCCGSPWLITPEDAQKYEKVKADVIAEHIAHLTGSSK